MKYVLADWRPCCHTIMVCERGIDTNRMPLIYGFSHQYTKLLRSTWDDIRVFCKDGELGWNCNEPHIFRFRHKWQAMQFKLVFAERVAGYGKPHN